MDKTIQSIGIIGLGSFGQFFANKLRAHATVLGYDTHPVPNCEAWQTTLERVATCDVVLLAIPLNAIASIITEIEPLLPASTLLVDICSVKLKPQEIIKTTLHNHRNILLTHPLFGPQSAAKDTRGHRLIVTKKDGKRAAAFLDFCEKILGLHIQHITPEQHDMAMARIHALTFFLARGLSNMGLTSSNLDTPSYDFLLDLVRLDTSQSEELFQTVITGNPYAKEVREHLMNELETLHNSLQIKERLKQ